MEIGPRSKEMDAEMDKIADKEVGMEPWHTAEEAGGWCKVVRRRSWHGLRGPVQGVQAAAHGSRAPCRDGGQEDVPRVGTRGEGDMKKKLERWRRRLRGRRREWVGRGQEGASQRDVRLLRRLREPCRGVLDGRGCSARACDRSVVGVQ